MNEEIKNEILSLTSGIGESVIDSVLSDGLFKDIPILGSLVSIVKLTSNISDRIFLKKLLTFFNALELKSQEEVDSLKQKILKEKDPKRIGSKILYAINLIDDDVKLKWLSKVFVKYIDKKISKHEFLTLTSIINQIYSSNADGIKVFKQREVITSQNKLIKGSTLEHLFSVGLLSNVGFDEGGASEESDRGSRYCLNEYGIIFMDILDK